MRFGDTQAILRRPNHRRHLTAVKARSRPLLQPTPVSVTVSRTDAAMHAVANGSTPFGHAVIDRRITITIGASAHSTSTSVCTATPSSADTKRAIGGSGDNGVAVRSRTPRAKVAGLSGSRLADVRRGRPHESTTSQSAQESPARFCGGSASAMPSRFAISCPRVQRPRR